MVLWTSTVNAASIADHVSSLTRMPFASRPLTSASVEAVLSRRMDNAWPQTVSKNNNRSGIDAA